MPRAPQKINSFIILDFESSGLDKKDGMHSHTVAATEFACIGLNGTTLEEIVAYDNIIKPYDNSLQWQSEASALTGLTKERCERDGIPLKQLVEDIITVIEETNLHNSKIAKPVLVAHNWEFDRQFFMNIFKRAKVDLSKYVAGSKDDNGNFIPKGIDTIDIAKWLWAEVTDTDTKFNLEACIQRAGLEMADSHRAMNDVRPLTDFLKYALTRLRSGSSEVTVIDGKATSIRQTFEW